MLAKLTKVTIREYTPDGRSYAGMNQPFPVTHTTIYINPAFVHCLKQRENAMKSKNELYELPITEIVRAGAMVAHDEVIGTIDEVAAILNQASMNIPEKKSKKAVAKKK